MVGLDFEPLFNVLKVTWVLSWVASDLLGPHVVGPAADLARVRFRAPEASQTARAPYSPTDKAALCAPVRQIEHGLILVREWRDLVM